MGKKVSLTSFKPRDHHDPCTKTLSSWSWPSCKQQPKTLSFRVGHGMFKMVNSVYLDMASDEVDSPFSCFISSSDCWSFSMLQEEYLKVGESNEAILRDLQSDRLFYEPIGESKCMAEKAIDRDRMILDKVIPNKEYVVLTMDSEDPYKDFRSSMEEVVEAHGMMEWDCLEELSLWYLKMNEKKTHRYIVGALADLIVEIVTSNLEKQGIDHEDDDLSESFDYQGEDFHAR